jgi:hypothetical protein
MYKNLVENYLSKDVNVSDYRQALQLLRRTGLLDILRRGGFPNITENGANLAAMAHEGSWSNGYQTAVNQLEYLEEFYANKTDPNAARVTPTFGAAKIAKSEGYLTEDELKKFK